MHFPEEAPPISLGKCNHTEIGEAVTCCLSVPFQEFTCWALSELYKFIKGKKKKKKTTHPSTTSLQINFPNLHTVCDF